MILATNPETVEVLRSAGGKSVRLYLDSGIRDEFLAAAPPVRNANSEFVILWAGHLDLRKALPLALEAMASVRKLPVRLLVAGDGPLRHNWERYASQLGIQDRVEFLGPVKWELMFALYREVDAFLFTSLRDSFGSVMLEAMSQGLPIITLSHQGAGAHVPSEAGIKVPVTTPRETVAGLAEAIRDLLYSPEKRSNMGSTGWEFARSHTWTRRAAYMIELYEQMSSPSKRSAGFEVFGASNQA